jgi:DNA-binding GntR family transcriptional regulator
MKSDSQANHAYHEIRRHILTAQLQPGVRLKEDYWANKLDVGRMAVREALTRLLGEGLVELGERGGYYVTEMTPKTCARSANCGRCSNWRRCGWRWDALRQAQLAQLDDICNDFSSLVQKGYVAGACEADIKFHETLLAASGNRRLLQAYHYAHIPLFHQKLGKTRVYLEDYDQTDREHRLIVEALAQPGPGPGRANPAEPLQAGRSGRARFVTHKKYIYPNFSIFDNS